ncbi:MAG: ABC transporter substrate-binding protein, partial [Chloroflexota bacterium]|nr:ABC transporter substrate-binding protein [Chloroflexota bacterium]
MHPTHLTRRSFVASTVALAASAALGRNAIARQGATPAATTYPLTVTHEGGETTLEQQPRRIAALEWHLVEDLLVLGIQPVAIADIEGYQTWVTIETELAEGVQDVGTRQEPSLEALAAADLDLILGVGFRHMAIYDQLNDIAPTIMMTAYPQEEGVTPLEDLRERLRYEGWFLDRSEAAEAAIEEMNATIDLQATRIEEAGLTGTPFVVTQAFTAENQPTFRIFSNQALVGDAISATGLDNIWTEDGGDWGFTTNTIEAFVGLP